MGVRVPDEVRYALLLKNALRLDPGAIARVLQPFVATPRADLTVALRAGCGILLLDVAADRVEPALRALDEAGFPAFALEHERFVDLPRTVKVVSADLLPDHCLASIGHDFNRKKVEWTAVRFAHIYALERSVLDREAPREHALVDPRNRIYSDAAAKIIEDVAAIEDEHKGMVLDLHLEAFCQEPLGLYRFDRKGFNYRYLGDRVCAHSIDNFLLLCRHFLGYAQAAVVPPSTREFLDTYDVAKILYTKREELLASTRWYLNAILARDWGALASGEGPLVGPPLATREEIEGRASEASTSDEPGPCEQRTLAVTIGDGTPRVEERRERPQLAFERREPVPYRILDAAGIALDHGEAPADLAMTEGAEGEIRWVAVLAIPWPSGATRAAIEVLGETVSYPSKA